jgi:hypothetical protein
MRRKRLLQENTQHKESSMRLLLIFTCFLIFYISGGANADVPAAGNLGLMGVNIHFTDARPGEMKMLAEAGFKWIRMDFNWGGIEREKGIYDWSAYDTLVASLKKYGIRGIFILDYSNPNYDQGLSPYTEEGRAAFARWAAAAVKHFRGDGILWEMYNEPNIGFWKPKPDTDAYTKLALAVGKAVRQSEPKETYIGPGSSGVDLNFLEACFKAGLLKYWSAVSVHPYRQSPPDTVMTDYARLRAMIDQYAPHGKYIPIISSEWGYSSVWGAFDPELQGEYLPREFLTNIAAGIPVSIWYDWHDDGLDPRDSEHHFGTTLNAYHQGRDPVYEPKPAWRAAYTLHKELNGWTYNKELSLNNGKATLMLFTRDKDIRAVVWGVNGAVTVQLPGPFHAVSYLGEPLDEDSAGEGLKELHLDRAPVYLEMSNPSAMWQIARSWQTAPAFLSIQMREQKVVALKMTNPLDHVIRVNGKSIPPGASVIFRSILSPDPSNPVESHPILLKAEGFETLVQTVNMVLLNPVSVSFCPLSTDILSVTVNNPGLKAFQCQLLLHAGSGKIKQTYQKAITIPNNQGMTTVKFRSLQGDFPYPVSAELTAPGKAGQKLVSTSGQYFVFLDRSNSAGTFSWDRLRVVPDGEAKVESTQNLQVNRTTDTPSGLEGDVCTLTYSMDVGWKFLRVVSDSADMNAIPSMSIDGVSTQPGAYGIWVKGDGQGCSPRIRFTDSSGQTFQPSSQEINWKGEWRFLEFSLKGNDSGHWGGANDGIVHGPIHWDSLFLLDGMGRQVSGAIELASPVLIYWK